MLSPYPEGRRGGQEPEHGWEEPPSPSPISLGSVLLLKRCGCPFPIPGPGDEGRSLALFSASWSPNPHPMYHRELSPQNLSKPSVNRIFTPFVQYSEKRK